MWLSLHTKNIEFDMTNHCPKMIFIKKNRKYLQELDTYVMDNKKHFQHWEFFLTSYLKNLTICLIDLSDIILNEGICRVKFYGKERADKMAHHRGHKIRRQTLKRISWFVKGPNQSYKLDIRGWLIRPHCI